MRGFGDWLVFHGGFPGAVPDPSTIDVGTSVSSILTVNGSAGELDWTVLVFDPPHEFRIAGKERGVTITVVLRVAPAGAGSTVTLQLELSGIPVIGPIGKAALNQLRPGLEESLVRFATITG